MINLGKFGFELALTSGNFAGQLANAGKAVSGFVDRNTRSFAGSAKTFNEYRSQVSRLTDQTATQARAIMDLTKANQAHDSDMRAAYGAYRKQEAVVQKLAETKQKLSDQLAETKKQYQQASDTQDKYTSHQAKLKAEIQSITDSLEAQKRAHAELEKQTREAHAEHKRLVAEQKAWAAAGAKSTASSLEPAKKAARSRHLSLAASRDQAKAELTQRQATYDLHVPQLQRQVDGISPYIKRLGREMVEISRQTTQYTEDSKNLESALDDQQKKLDGLGESAREASDAYSLTSRALHNQTEEFKDAAEELSELKKQADTVPGQFALMAEQINNVSRVATTTFKKTSATVGPAVRDFEVFTRKIRNVSDGYASIKDRIYDLEDSIRKNRLSLRTQEAVYEKMQKKTLATEASIEHSRAKLIEHTAYIKEQEAKMARARAAAAAASHRNDQIDLDIQKAKIAAFEANIEKRKEEYKVTERNLERREKLLEEDKQREEQQLALIDRIQDKVKGQISQRREQQQALRRQAAEEKRLAQAQKEGAQATDEQTDSIKKQESWIDRIVKSWMFWLGLSPKAAQGNQELARSFDPVQRQVSATTKSLSRMNSFIRDVLVGTISNTLGGVLSGLILKFGEFNKFGFGQVREFENLQFSMNALLAKEHREMSGGSISFLDALDATKEKTNQTIAEIEKLAITSTFTSQELSGVFAKLTQGFSSLQSDRIMRATSLFGDVFRKTGYELEGMATVLVQIQNTGKLTKEDLNQLTQTYGVPALKYLADAYDTSTSSILEMITAGEILADDAIPAIVKGLETDFAGANTAAGLTISGLASSMVDLGQRVVRSLFAPAVEELKRPLMFMVNALQNEAFLTAVEDLGYAIGETLAGAFNTLANILPHTGTYLRDFADFVVDALGNVVGVATLAWDWGSMIVESFIDGMMSKVSYIEDATSWIGDQLAYWMEPHSPPKMAPNLDKWGEKTGETYYEGMAGADASAAAEAMGDKAMGMGGVATAGIGGAAVGGLAETNGILTYIAQLMEGIASHFLDRGASSSVSRTGSRSRLSSRNTGEEEEESSESYRLKLEQMLGGKGGAPGAPVDEDAKKVSKAEVKLAVAEGDYEKAIGILRSMQDSTDSQEEYIKLQTEIVRLEQRQQRELERTEKTRTGTTKTRTSSQEAERRRQEAAAKKAERDRKAAEDSQIRYLEDQEDYAGALAIVENRLGNVQEGTKEYYDTLRKAEQLRNKITADEEAAAAREGLGLTLDDGTTGDPELPEEKAIVRIQDRLKNSDFGKQLQVFQKRIQDVANEVTRSFQTVTDWIEKHQNWIGWVLTTVAMKFARGFFITKILPVMKQFSVSMNTVGASIFRLLTPLNLLKLAINALFIVWLKNIGGFRDMTAQVFDQIQPGIERISGMLQTIFQAGDVNAMIAKFQESMPLLRYEIRAVFDTITSGFMQWADPFLEQATVMMDGLTERITVWGEGTGFSRFLDSFEKIFLDLQNWISGQDPETWVVGVIAKITATIVTMTKTIVGLLAGTVSAAIIAFGPEISRRLRIWGRYLTEWIHFGLPRVAGALGMFTTVVLGGITSGLIELIRVLGNYTIELAAWVLPAIPQVISALGDMVFAAVSWLLVGGIPQLTRGFFEWTATALTALGNNLPELGLNLGQAFTRLVVQLFSLAAVALGSAVLWVPILTQGMGDILVAMKDVSIGLTKGLIALVVGAVTGVVTPLMDAARLAIQAEGFLEWLRSLGIDWVNALLEGVQFEMPQFVRDIVTSFDAVMFSFKQFAGIPTGLMSEIDLLKARIDGTATSFEDLYERMGPLGKSITQIGSTVAVGVTIWQAYGLAVRSNAIASLATFAQTLYYQVITALGVQVSMTKTATGITTQYAFTGVAAAVRSTILWASTMRKQLISALMTMITTVRTHGVGSLALFATTIKTSVIPSLLTMIGTIRTQGISGLMAWVKQLFVANAALLAQAAAIGAAVAAIAGIVYAYNWAEEQLDKFTQKLLNSKQWWIDSKEALEKYANASEDVQQANLKLASELEKQQRIVEAHVEKLFRMESQKKSFGWFSGVSDEEIQEQQDLANEEIEKLQLLEQELSDSVTGAERLAARKRVLTDVEGDFTLAVAQTADEVREVEDALKSTLDAIENSFDDMASLENDFLRDRENANEDHKERMIRINRETRDARQRDLQEERNIAQQIADEQEEQRKAEERIAALKAEIAVTDDEFEKSRLQQELDQELQAVEMHQERIVSLTGQHEEALTKIEENEHSKRREMEQKAFEEQEAQAALAYVKERQRRRREMGERLMDMVRQQAALSDETDMEKARLLIDDIAEQYGVQQTFSERALMSMENDVYSFLTSTRGTNAEVLAELERTADEVRDNQALVDELTEKRTMEIVQQYQEEGRTPEELTEALEQVPAEVDVLVKTHLDDPNGLLSGEPIKVTVETEEKPRQPTRDRRPSPDAPTPEQGEEGIPTSQTGPEPPPKKNTKPSSPPPRTRTSPGGDPQARALGGPVRANELYEVAENNIPELLSVGQRTFLMMGNRAGHVIAPVGNALGNLGGRAANRLGSLRGLESFSGAGAASGMGMGNHQINMPITISGNSVRSDADLDALQKHITNTIIGTIDQLVVRGLK